MDRQIIFAVAIAVGTMLGFSGLFFGQTPPSDQPRPQYAPDDVRYSHQQADLKKKKKTKKPQKPAKEEFTSGTTSTGGGDSSSSDAGEGENEEPAAEEPEAEEPPLD